MNANPNRQRIFINNANNNNTKVNISNKNNNNEKSLTSPNNTNLENKLNNDEETFKITLNEIKDYPMLLKMSPFYNAHQGH